MRNKFHGVWGVYRSFRGFIARPEFKCYANDARPWNHEMSGKATIKIEL